MLKRNLIQVTFLTKIKARRESGFLLRKNGTFIFKVSIISILKYIKKGNNMLSLDQIESNWNKLLGFIEDGFEGERKQGLLTLYNEHADRIAAAPASAKVYYHSAFLGGYVHHVLNILRIAPRMSTLWESLGGEKIWTDEELFFVALNHDLGKIGDVENEYYLETTEDWKTKRGIQFDYNPVLPYMKVQDRSLFLLQHYGIKMTQREFMAIQLHDGLYEEGNKAYYMHYSPSFELDRFIHVVHFADMFASKLEYEEWAKSPEGKQFLKGESKLKPKTLKGKKSLDKILNNEELKDENLKVKSFEDLFGNVFGETK